MKNIFVLPSDKPSRVYKNEIGGLGFTDIKFTNKDGFCTNHNMYITNSEEIKHNDWICNGDVVFKRTSTVNLNILCQKIVLCTDPELIKNGVQLIDDDFLEWFVKNSSCEFVEVEKEECQMWSLIGCDKDDVGCCKKPIKGYKPIIPQPKQETIEEVAERLVPEAGCELNNSEASYWQQGWISGHIEGAKWQKHQSEKMFSEEDMRKSFCNGYRANVKSCLNDAFQDWLTQHKKH